MGVADLGEEAEEFAGGEFALAGDNVAVAVVGRRIGDAVLVVDVLHPLTDFVPRLFRRFLREFPGVVGVPKHAEGLIELFVQLAAVFSGGESVVGLEENFAGEAVFGESLAAAIDGLGDLC